MFHLPYADELRNLANRDALTGIRNKKAYDELIQKLEEDLKKGKTKFGFAMVDLNFLKKINDSIIIIAEDIYLQPWDKISAAIGVALYDPAIDKSVNEVFMRADAAMYKRKQDMKAAQS